jgi:collagen type III alpha
MAIFTKILMSAALMCSGSVFAQTPGWTISEASGSVTILKSGISRAAVRGGTLAIGDFVSTASSGRAVLIRGGEYLVVSPGSRIRIADPVTSGGFTQIIQSFGNTIFRIKKKTTPHFAVETPYLAAVVKGTTFSVTVTDSGTAVQVTEGLVQVSTNDGGATHLVRPGDIGSVDAAHPLRLTIQGKESKTIESPNKPTAKSAPSASIAASAETAFAEDAKSNADAVQDGEGTEIVSDVAATVEPARSVFDSVINAPVGEGVVRLDIVTNGLVSGNSALLAAANPVQPVGQISAVVAAAVPVVEAPLSATDSSFVKPTVISQPIVEVAEAKPVLEVAPTVAEVAVVASQGIVPVLDVALAEINITNAGTKSDLVAPSPLLGAPEVSSPLPAVDVASLAPNAAGQQDTPAMSKPGDTDSSAGDSDRNGNRGKDENGNSGNDNADSLNGNGNSTPAAHPQVTSAASVADPETRTPSPNQSSSQGSDGQLTSCAGVPNCNGSTYTGPSNVDDGRSCAGIANCNGGAAHVNGNSGSGNSGFGSNGNNGSGDNGSNGSGGGNGNGNGQNGNGNGNSSNGNGNGNGNNGNGNGSGSNDQSDPDQNGRSGKPKSRDR